MIDKDNETTTDMSYILFKELVNRDTIGNNIHCKIFNSSDKAFEAMFQAIGSAIYNKSIPRDWECEVKKDSVEFYKRDAYKDYHVSYRIKQAPKEEIGIK